MEAEWRLRASVRTPVSRPARSTVRQWRGAAIRFASGPSQVLTVNRDVGPSADSRPVRLLAAVSSDRPRNAGRRRFSFGYFQDPS